MGTPCPSARADGKRTKRRDEAKAEREGKTRIKARIQRPDALRAATASRRNDSASTESAATRTLRRRPPASTTSESSAPPHWAAPVSRPFMRQAPERENAAKRSMPISMKAGCARRHAAKARPPAAPRAHAGGKASQKPPNHGASVAKNASAATAIPARRTACITQDGRKAIRGVRGACTRRVAERESRPAGEDCCAGAAAVSLRAITSGP